MSGGRSVTGTRTERDKRLSQLRHGRGITHDLLGRNDVRRTREGTIGHTTGPRVSGTTPTNTSRWVVRVTVGGEGRETLPVVFCDLPNRLY